MAVSDKVRALLNIKGKKLVDMANYFDMSPQAMRNKLSRDSFSAIDLIKVADFLGCTLQFDAGENQKIILGMSDVRQKQDGECENA